MKRTSLILSALLLAVVPAIFGLWGNASFSQAVPVTVPPSGQVATGVDDHGGDVPRDLRTEPGDDRRGDDTPTPGPSASPRPHPTARPSATVDDHGGDRPRDQRTEPGDDRDLRSDDSGHGTDDSATHDSATDDSRHRSGSSGSGSDDSGSDDSGHGSGDSGSDDSRHGSDHGEDD